MNTLTVYRSYVRAWRLGSPCIAMGHQPMYCHGSPVVHVYLLKACCGMCVVYFCWMAVHRTAICRLISSTLIHSLC